MIGYFIYNNCDLERVYDDLEMCGKADYFLNDICDGQTSLFHTSFLSWLQCLPVCYGGSTFIIEKKYLYKASLIKHFNSGSTN